MLLTDAALHPNRSEAAASVGDHILVLFWSDDCEPSVEAMLQHASDRRKPPGRESPLNLRHFYEST